MEPCFGWLVWHRGSSSWLGLRKAAGSAVAAAYSSQHPRSRRSRETQGAHMGFQFLNGRAGSNGYIFAGVQVPFRGNNQNVHFQGFLKHCVS